jgi:hypothetical protein
MTHQDVDPVVLLLTRHADGSVSDQPAFVVGIVAEESYKGADDEPALNLVVLQDSPIHVLSGPTWQEGFVRHCGIKHHTHGDFDSGKGSLAYCEAIVIPCGRPPVEDDGELLNTATIADAAPIIPGELPTKAPVKTPTSSPFIHGSKTPPTPPVTSGSAAPAGSQTPAQEPSSEASASDPAPDHVGTAGTDPATSEGNQSHG